MGNAMETKSRTRAEGSFAMHRSAAAADHRRDHVIGRKERSVRNHLGHSRRRGRLEPGRDGLLIQYQARALGRGAAGSLPALRRALEGCTGGSRPSAHRPPAGDGPCGIPRRSLQFRQPYPLACLLGRGDGAAALRRDAADFDRARYEAMRTACKEVLADLGRDDAEAEGGAVATDPLSEGLWLRMYLRRPAWIGRGRSRSSPVISPVASRSTPRMCVRSSRPWPEASGQTSTNGGGAGLAMGIEGGGDDAEQQDSTARCHAPISTRFWT